jgi:hypothetical protein
MFVGRRDGANSGTGANLMQQSRQQRDAVTASSGYFHRMFERCEARAAGAKDGDDRGYWLGLAQIWGKLADREGRE